MNPRVNSRHDRLAKRRVRDLLRLAGPDEASRAMLLGAFIARHLNQLFTEFPEQAANYSRSELEALRAERSVERLEPVAVRLAGVMFALRAARDREPSFRRSPTCCPSRRTVPREWVH